MIVVAFVAYNAICFQISFKFIIQIKTVEGNCMKKVLLIGGGGTLGSYTAKELLNKGHSVDIICLEDKTSDNKNLAFYKGAASFSFLSAFLKDKMYDGIVNLIHYREVGEYPSIHDLLMAHTRHLIVLSSYRVYADEQHPVTEQAPMLLDVSEDQEFLATEKYALSKAKLEKFLNSERKGQHWTIVRPVISFSKLRFDLVTYSGHKLLDKIKNNETILLPAEAKDQTAGLDWAGNSGKLIAALLFDENTYGEAYTVSSAQNLTWGEVADLYIELMGAIVKWIPLNEYLEAVETPQSNYFMLVYDRLFDRKIDNSKILKATGLTRDDFLPIKEGLKREISYI